ncbi:SDR family NAD(P)-dependent oxidoreductase [Asaia platycodi]|uniref:SDR family NAD(P)-dependent oxidoreductase n=1 Tax=Asaia platycodi TaxID=610243 RepID=UPI0009E01C9F
MVLIQSHDVTPEEQWTAAYAWTKEPLSGIDVLVNVAGIHIVVPVDEISSRHRAA